MDVAGISTVVIPIVAAIGGAVGAFVAIIKVIPERTAIIVGSQARVLESLELENRRQAQLIADLELRVRELEDQPPRYLG